MKGYYCNTCKKKHRVMEVCKYPVISQRDLEDRIEYLEKELSYYNIEYAFCQGHHWIT